MQTALRSLQKERAYHEDSLTKAESTVTKTQADLEYTKQQKCPTCEQSLHDDKHELLVANTPNTLQNYKAILQKYKKALTRWET